MKKSKSKILNLLLAASLGVAIGTATVGGALLLSPEKASAAETYKPTNVFSALSSASIAADGEDKTKMAFTIPNGGSVQYRRDLALTWHEGVNAEYLSFSFEVKEFNFATLTVALETAAAASQKESKAVNKIVFETKEEKVLVKVGEKTDDESVVGIEYDKAALADRIQISLTKTGASVPNEGEYFVMMKVGESAEAAIGSFTNIGSSFAEYASSSSSTPITPLSLTVKMPDGATDAKSVIYFHELNKQSFALNDDGEVTDTAKPVLVVNEEISSFALGTPFSLEYELIDVLDTTVSKTLQYYQYKPNNEEAKYKELKTTTYFYDTAYDSDGDGKTDTTVYKKDGQEYISVRFKLEDDSHKGDDNAAIYYLSWYAASTVTPTLGGATASVDGNYISANRNDEAPKYAPTFNAEAVEAYQAKVTEAAKDVNAGSSSYVYLPSLRGIITDNDTGYTSLKFNVYFRTRTSDTTSSTNLAYDKLKITTATDGLYEFKIAAVDKSGNTMKATVDGEEVTVGSDNIWDADEIPSFTFEVANNGLKIDEESDYDRSDKGTIDVEYSLSEFDVNSVDSDYGKDYFLYIFDLDLFRSKFPTVSLVSDDLSKIAYKDINSEYDFASVEDGDYEAFFLKKYAQKLAANLDGVTAEALIEEDSDGRTIIRKIGEQQTSVNDKVYPDNKYEWNPTDRTFLPNEESIFLVFGVFTDSVLPGEAVMAYKVVEVEATIDTIHGDTQWLKNNIASVILFSIAAVMLILIIILLLVKPSDETLEDVDKAAKALKVSKKENKAE